MRARASCSSTTMPSMPRRLEALSAAWRARPGAGHVECPRLARGGLAGRDQAVAEGDRCRLSGRAHRSRAEREAAVALSEALGGLPLAHEQAAAYCERLDISFADYAKRFEAAPAKFLDDTRHAPAEYHDGLTVAKTFALAIDEAARLHPAAEPLIVHAALLALEPLPLFLFSEGREKFGEPLSSALKDDGLDEAVASLRAFALIDRETIADERDPAITTDCIRLHRLVRQVAAARYEGETREDAHARAAGGSRRGLSGSGLLLARSENLASRTASRRTDPGAGRRS